MKFIKKWIKNLILHYYHWKVKRRYRHAQLTPQGQYLVKYIIDYYINETTTEPIQHYEEKITNFSEHISVPKTATPIPKDLMPQFLHYHAAMIMLKAFLFASPNKQEWLDTIQDEHIRNQISDVIFLGGKK